EAGYIWLEQSEIDAYGRGERIFELQTNATKIKAASEPTVQHSGATEATLPVGAISRNLAGINWVYTDDKALMQLEQRIAAAGRRQELVYYSDLVRGIPFILLMWAMADPIKSM